MAMLRTTTARRTQTAVQQVLRHADGAARARDRIVATTTPRYERLNVFISGGTSAITTGIKSAWMAGKNYVVKDWAIVADASGSIQLDLKTCTHADYPTATSICGASTKPTVTSAQKSTADPDISDWTTALARGDWLVVSVVSAATVKWVTLEVLLQVVPEEPPN